MTEGSEPTLGGRMRPPDEGEPLDPDLVGPNRGAARARVRPAAWAAVGMGGVLGAIARYELALAVTSRPGTFPLSTFVINVTGSLVLGALLVLLVGRWPSARYLRPFAATGFLGAYTTWSTFMVDADDLVKGGHVGIAAGYVAASLAGGLAATATGMAAGRRWVPRRGGNDQPAPWSLLRDVGNRK
jgi:CrcB protein